MQLPSSVTIKTQDFHGLKMRHNRGNIHSAPCLFISQTFPGNSSAYHEARATRLSMLVYIGFQCDTRRLIQERCAARETGSRHSCVQDVEYSTYECCLFRNCFMILVAGLLPKPGPKVHHIRLNILPLLHPPPLSARLPPLSFTAALPRRLTPLATLRVQRPLSTPP